MILNDKKMLKLLDDVENNINEIAQESYKKILELVTSAYTPLEARRAIEKEIKKLSDNNFEAIKKGFENILGGSVSTEYLKNYEIDKLDLSKKLYKHSRGVNLQVQKILNDAIKDKKATKNIGMLLYEGYNFQDDPLKVVSKIPKYLQDDIIKQSIKRTDKLKTPALRAMYNQVVLKGINTNLEKSLRNAIYEKNRYLANRIANYELYRAYTDEKSREIIEDKEIECVQIVLNEKLHKIFDVCDYHTSVDLYGLGRGVYPKDKAPKPPFHPHCNCIIKPHRASADKAKYNPKAQREYMSSLSDVKKRGILITKENVFQYENKKNSDVVSMLDNGKDERYKTKYLGEVGRKYGIMPTMDKYREIEGKFLEKLTDFNIGDIENSFLKLWNDESSYNKHIRKRLLNGDITDIKDYIKKTFLTLGQKNAYYEHYKVADVWDRVLYNKELEWVVILGENGSILTSYKPNSTITQLLTKHKTEYDTEFKEVEVSDEFQQRVREINNKLRGF